MFPRPAPSAVMGELQSAPHRHYMAWEGSSLLPTDPAPSATRRQRVHIVWAALALLVCKPGSSEENWGRET